LHTVAVSAVDPSRLEARIDRSHPSNALYTHIVSQRIQSLLRELPAESSGTDGPGQDYLAFWFSHYKSPLLNLINSIFNIPNLPGSEQRITKFTLQRPPTEVTEIVSDDSPEAPKQHKNKKRKRQENDDHSDSDEQMRDVFSISEDSSESDDDDDEIISIGDDDDDVIEILDDEGAEGKGEMDMDIDLPELPEIPQLDLSMEMQQEIAKTREEVRLRRSATHTFDAPGAPANSSTNVHSLANPTAPSPPKSAVPSATTPPKSEPLRIPPATGEFAEISNQVLERLKLLHDIAILDQSLGGHSQKLAFQRSEFFGDSVLEYYVYITLYRTKTFAPGSLLAAMRTFMVTNRNLADVFDALRLQYMLPWKSFDQNDLKQKADVVEAIIGELESRLSEAGRTPTQARLIEETRDILVSFIMYFGERYMYRTGSRGGGRPPPPARKAPKRETEKKFTQKQLEKAERRAARLAKKISRQHSADATSVVGPTGVALYPEHPNQNLERIYDLATPDGWDRSVPYRFYRSPPFPPPPNIKKLSVRKLKQLHNAAIRAGKAAQYAGFLKNAEDYPPLQYLDPIVNQRSAISSNMSSLAREAIAVQKAVKPPPQPSSSSSSSKSASVKPQTPTAPVAAGKTNAASQQQQRTPPPAASKVPISFQATASTSKPSSQKEASASSPAKKKAVPPTAPTALQANPIQENYNFHNMFMSTSIAPVLANAPSANMLAQEVKQREFAAAPSKSPRSGTSLSIAQPPPELMGLLGPNILRFPMDGLAATQIPQQQAPKAPPKLNPTKQNDK
jgi:dsRNA-specific ribonuclease